MRNVNTVLIVEDELIISKLIAYVFESLGLKVIGTKNSSNKAIDTALTGKPDIICMDIDLGRYSDFDGIATAEYLQKQLDFILIYISGTTDRQTMERAECLTNYNAFIKKPFRKDDLIEVLKTVNLNAADLR